jgi:molecular chaperone GrpE (heat shock protein)
MDIALVVAALSKFNDAESPTKKEVEKLVDAVRGSGINELQEWLEELTGQVEEASNSIEALTDADSDEREECFEAATVDVAQVLESLNDALESVRAVAPSS